MLISLSSDKSFSENGMHNSVSFPVCVRAYEREREITFVKKKRACVSQL